MTERTVDTPQWSGLDLASGPDRAVVPLVPGDSFTLGSVGPIDVVGLAWPVAFEGKIRITATELGLMPNDG